MEELDELGVVTPPVLEDEALECRVALLPGPRPVAQQRLELVEVRLVDRVPDLVVSREMVMLG